MSVQDESVGTVSSRCQKVVDDANAGRITSVEARQKLESEGISGEVLQSYLVQLQRLPEGSGRAPDSEDNNSVDRGRTPEGLDEDQRQEFRRRRAEIVGRAQGVGGDPSQGATQAGVGVPTNEGNPAAPEPNKDSFLSDSSVLAQQLKAIERLVGGEGGSISPSTLNSLPHLREKAMSTGDPHVDETLRTKRVYLREQSMDSLVDLFQNEYISFEKLLAGIDPGYDHRDEGKDFGAGYTLIKNDHLSAKKPVVSELDWNRAFGAWKNAVVEAYPHRSAELSNYGTTISNLFRNFAHDPSIPIRTDHEVRERYHKSPFRLDDLSRIQAAVLALVHRSSMGGKNKRSSNSSIGGRASKRVTGAICLNWNASRCDDPCANGRRHGICSVCGGKHRAFDSGDCKGEFIVRRARSLADKQASAGSSTRA
ncbi:hypothetical protein FB446DRAFT_650843 [Lentinula raphanica]|nr:hypothetical protein FB446DRAFT_650843 [Lentinula raphanica]